MKKFLAFTLLPLTFAILGAFSHEFFQRIPKGNWEMVMSNEYQLYNLDARPIYIMGTDFSGYLYLKTETEKLFSCYYYQQNSCSEISDLATIEYFITESGRDIKKNEIPKFDKDIEDIALFEVGFHETLTYKYYIISSDGSVWFWSWGDNLYEDFFGWAGLGCLGFSIGIALASWITQKKNDR